MRFEQNPILISDNNVNEPNPWHSQGNAEAPANTWTPAYQIWEYPTAPINPIFLSAQSPGTDNILAPNTVPSLTQANTDRSLLAKTKSDTASTSFDSSAVNRMSHEVYVLSQGLCTGYVQGAREALADPAGSALRLGSSLLYAAAITKLGYMSNLIGQSFVAGGTIAGISDMALDGSGRAKFNSLGSALSDAWRPDANLNDDVDKVSGSLGRLCFDTTMLSLAAAIGGRAARTIEADPGTPVASGVKGALRSTYGNDDAVYLRKNDQADLSLGGTTIRHWFGSDVPTPETVETADGVKITTFGKDVQIREKPNDYLIVDHPKGRSELHVQSGLKINEAKTDGKYSERTFDYANGLKIRQFADGRLHFNLNGVDRYAINKDGKIFNPDANEKVWQANNLPLARSLPARPQISEDNGSHVLTFENGARLHMMPSGMKLVSGGALREMP